MILTITLNPAVDKTCRIQELILGQVNRLESTKSIAGGKGVNVTKILRQFGYPVTAMGFLGGYSGRMIEEALEKMGAICRFTHIVQETRVSTNILAENGYVTEILEPGPEITKEELQRFLTEYEKQLAVCEIVVLSGSIPKGVPADIYKTLTELAKKQGCKVFLDTSGEALKMAVEAVPYFIKPNHKELEFLLGRKVEGVDELVTEAEALLAKGMEKVVISLGAKGL
ncbi:MAG: 1-phosphofructokinase family hexose kinase, partial [Lachnospiraceae bacterium]|nr:1-phosphofructokinase family hexose kinase [Lachnospiraceae bacterium]